MVTSARYLWRPVAPTLGVSLAGQCRMRAIEVVRASGLAGSEVGGQFLGVTPHWVVLANLAVNYTLREFEWSVV